MRKVLPLIVLVSVIVTSSFLFNSNIMIVTSTNANNNYSSNNNIVIADYEVPELPDEPLPEWELNITGIGITDAVTLNLADLIEDVNDSYLDAYEQVVEYKGCNQTIIGFDILQLIQDYADVWYAGELTFIAEDGWAKSLNTTQITYSYYPPALENADIKILLAFAINGSYLENTDWADDGCLRLVVPSNYEYTYANNYWIGNVTTIEVTELWKCDVYLNNELETSVEINIEDSYPDFEYESYQLSYHSENTQFEGITILSILDYIDVNIDDIITFEVGAPDGVSALNVSELTGEKPAILATVIGEDYFGYNGGPFRLVGGNVLSYHWVKNVCAIYISDQATGGAPGYNAVIAFIAIFSTAALAVIARKRK